MTEYSRSAKGNFTATSARKVVNLPFQPDLVIVRNATNIAVGLSALKVTKATFDSSLIITAGGVTGPPTLLELYNVTPASSTDVIMTNGISTFSAGLALQYGATQQIIGITKDNPARVNVTAHGYVVGDTVIMQGLALATTNNMQLLNGVPFTIVAVSDADHFDVKWDTSTSAYTALTGSPAGALVKKVLYPFLYLPQDNIISAITTGSTTTVTTTMYHDFEVGQEIAFRVPNFWGTTQLNSLPNVLIPGSPIYGYVTSITDNWTFVCNINSSSFTAFTANATMSATTLVGLTYAQTLAVGDVNTGGNIITATSPLYPSPQFPTSTNRVPTINGPAIRGAFVNNTSQGFIIGPGVAVTSSTATIMTSGDVVEWEAFLHDLSIP